MGKWDLREQDSQLSESDRSRDDSSRLKGCLWEAWPAISSEKRLLSSYQSTECSLPGQKVLEDHCYSVTQMALCSEGRDSGNQSLRSASPAPSSILAHRPHSLHFWWVTPEGAINGEAKAKHLALRETSQLLHSSPQLREMKWSTEGDEQGKGGGGARIQMQTQNTPKHLVSHL